MSVEQPLASTLLNLPSHSKLHRVIAVDIAARDKSVVVQSDGRLGLYQSGVTEYYTYFKTQAQTADVLYQLPMSQGAVSSVLTNDGSGILTWTMPAAAGIGGTVGGGTEGSVLFVGAGPVLAQDNANLFYNDTLNELMVGTNVSGDAHFQIKRTAIKQYGIRIDGNTVSSTALTTIGVDINQLIANDGVLNRSAYGVKVRLQSDNSIAGVQVESGQIMTALQGVTAITGTYAVTDPDATYSAAGVYGEISTTQTFTGDGFTIDNKCLEAFILLSNSINTAGTITINTYGVYSKLTDNTTYTAGTSTRNNYGGYFYAVTANSGGTLNTYGVYIDTVSGGSAWALYSNATASSFFNGLVGIGTNAPTDSLTIEAGTTSIAPVCLTSGSLTTGGNIRAGQIQFLTDKFYGTISTGPLAKEFTLNDSALTSGRVPFATTNGRLTDDADMTFATDTLTVTKLITTTSITNNGLTSGRVTFAGASGLLTDDADMTFSGSTLTVTDIIGTTDLMTPLVFGGTSTTADLTLKSTSGNGISGTDILLVTGNNGATTGAQLHFDGTFALFGIGVVPTSFLHVNGVQPASVAGTGTAGTAITTILGATGGNTTGTAGPTGGIGSLISMTGGTGGTANSATSGTATAGAGGAITSTGGTGGSNTLSAASPTSKGGAGGLNTLSGGQGGTGTNSGGVAIGGNGGGVTISGGLGGSSSASSTSTAGNGGNVTITAGQAGQPTSGTLVVGTAGTMTISGGTGSNISSGSVAAGTGGSCTVGGGAGGTQAGTSTSGAGGVATFQGGSGSNASGSNTGGAGGNCTVRGGTAGTTSSGTNGAAGTMTVIGGTGGGQSINVAGTAGGLTTISGGTGGATSTNTSGAGGELRLTGGVAGSNSGGSSGAGGIITFQVAVTTSLATCGNIDKNGRWFIGGSTTATAVLHLAAGTATASTAPLKYTSGTLLSSAEAGASEFLTDNLYITITTGAARKGIVLDDGTLLTSGRVPFATTNGRLTDDSDMTFSGATLTVTGLVIGTTKLTSYNGVSTVSNGLASILATVDLTNQSAAIVATTIYAVPAAGAGMYRVSWTATITTAATISSVLGGTNGFQIKYTDADDSVVKTTAAPVITTAANTTGTQISGCFIGYCKASTNLQYLFDYTSSGVTAMVYNLHIKVEFLG